MDKHSDQLADASSAIPGQRGFDYLIVGAGFAGSVLAERLANVLNQRVLLVDKRPHIGGNAFDRYDDHGVLIHPYGPHIFHTNSADIFEHLSRFTEWLPYQHRVLASVDGQLLPLPINLNTVNELYGLSLSAFEMDDWLSSVAEKKDRVLNSEDVIVSRVGRDLYNKFFRGYTRKQWGLDPSQLDASVTARVPTRTNRDDRYFSDKFQAMPSGGYTRMFERMLSHPNIKVMLNTEYREIVDLVPWKHMIYSGPIDAFFNFKHGQLPYRSLRFEHRNLNRERFQAVGTVNYPNEYAYTRISEFKHITGQTHPSTSVVYEYPCAEGDPYYPIPRPENAELYRRYEAEAEALNNVTFVGRLATYKYYNMDQVVGQSLAAFKQLRARHEASAHAVAQCLPLPVTAPG
jgi:UDP-galactopyranose mutase